MANSERCAVCHTSESNLFHSPYSGRNYHRFEPESISGEAQIDIRAALRKGLDGEASHSVVFSQGENSGASSLAGGESTENLETIIFGLTGDMGTPAVGGTEESAGPRITNSGTYGELPAKIRDLELIQPHEWDNMTVHQQRDWLMEHWPAAAPSLTPHCPKCGAEVVYALGGVRVYCKKDAAHEFEVDRLEDFAQFFSAQEVGQ